MARPAATPEEQAAQRLRLRVAASELHREGGVGAVTVRAVAKRAGVSTGLLYSYFANRSDLLRSLWAGPIAELGRRLARVEAETPDPVERIGHLLQTYVDFAVDHEETHRGLLLFVRPPNSTTSVNDDPDRLRLFASLRRAVEAGQASGQVQPGDAKAIAQLLWSGVHGALALPINIDTYDLAPGPTIATDMIPTLVRAISISHNAAPTGRPTAIHKGTT